ncbi:hypothetical protein [Nocardia brasiliensis]|uniref:hypothetical protein n=1 Tax=Nocardia brasiliensis TaxID=37326 RepID=UPI001580933A|nr:hypothetical protein [Nocardia brasiliensis]
MAAGFAPHGREVALATVWGPVARDFDIAPYDEAWFDAAADAVLVTGKPVFAEFAHLWRVADGKISGLHQYTDTWCWRTALAA